MGTFQRIETVDARQFTGGIENGSNLALWVNSNGQTTETRAEWLPEIKGTLTHIPERVRVRNYTFRDDVYVGDWVVLKQDGTFDTMRPRDFALAGYVKA